MCAPAQVRVRELPRAPVVAAPAEVRQRAAAGAVRARAAMQLRELPRVRLRRQPASDAPHLRRRHRARGLAIGISWRASAR